MFLVTLAIQPKTIIEIGTGTRSSTLALALASSLLPSPCTVFGVDIQPVNFNELIHNHFREFKFGKVENIITDLTKFFIPETWERPLLMLYDAHDFDLPGSIISTHALHNWFPDLASQVVMIHDFSVVSADREYTLDSEHISADHHSGIRIVGYHEVNPLIQWMNKKKIPLDDPLSDLYDLGFNDLSSSLLCFNVPGDSVYRSKPLKERMEWIRQITQPDIMSNILVEQIDLLQITMNQYLNYLQRHFIGISFGRELVRSGSMVLMNPTSPADYLTTPFIKIPAVGKEITSKGILELDCSTIKNQTQRLVITVQDHVFQPLAEIHTQRGQERFEVTFTIPPKTKSMRLVIACENERPCFLPDKISLVERFDA